MSDADNNFGGSLGLDFRKWWRHLQPKNTSQEHRSSFAIFRSAKGISDQQQE